MTRRRLLLVLSALLAVLGGTWWTSGRRHLGPAAARLSSAVGPADSARAVGRAVLPALPAGTDAAHLVLDIARALNSAPADLAMLPERDLRARILETIRSEHLAGRTVSVQGWEISATEARLYALAALR